MSNKEHLQELDERLGHLPAGGPEGGACLNRHEGGAPCSNNKNSCFHRWQAYVKMEDEQTHYNGKYDELADRKSDWIRVAAPGMPPYARRWLPRPDKTSWDYGKFCRRRVWNSALQMSEERDVLNFHERSSVPYNHQAHHLIPNGELADTIQRTFSDIDAVIPVRRGLLKAEYNLNHKDNVIMLPMDRVVGQTIGLPLHQSCWSARSHKAWSAYVEKEIEPIFNPLKDQLEGHKKRNYATVRQQLENKARALRKKVLEAKTMDTLDKLAKSLIT